MSLTVSQINRLFSLPRSSLIRKRALNSTDLDSIVEAITVLNSYWKKKYSSSRESYSVYCDLIFLIIVVDYWVDNGWYKISHNQSVKDYDPKLGKLVSKKVINFRDKHSNYLIKLAKSRYFCLKFKFNPHNDREEKIVLPIIRLNGSLPVIDSIEKLYSVLTYFAFDEGAIRSTCERIWIPPLHDYFLGSSKEIFICHPTERNAVYIAGFKHKSPTNVKLTSITTSNQIFKIERSDNIARDLFAQQWKTKKGVFNTEVLESEMWWDYGSYLYPDKYESNRRCQYPLMRKDGERFFFRQCALIVEGNEFFCTTHKEKMTKYGLHGIKV